MDRAALLEELARRIAALQPGHPTRVALDGVDAAGKTTLADELIVPLERLGRPVIRASVDGFHNPREVRYRRGPNSAEGYFLDSFDYPALIAHLLEPLGPGGNLLYKNSSFEYRADAALPTLTQQADPQAILLLDGVFLLRPELLPYWDYRIFVAVDFDTALRRAERRDAIQFGSPAAVRERYAQRYIPGQRLYLASCRPEMRADAVVINRDPSNPELKIAA